MCDVFWRVSPHERAKIGAQLVDSTLVTHNEPTNLSAATDGGHGGSP